jgi:hypothetical protein
MTKRILAFALAAVLALFALVSCGGEGEEKTYTYEKKYAIIPNNAVNCVIDIGNGFDKSVHTAFLQ